MQEEANSDNKCHILEGEYIEEDNIDIKEEANAQGNSIQKPFLDLQPAYLEHDSEVNIAIDGLPTYSMEQLESQLLTEEDNSEQKREVKMFKNTIRKVVLKKKGKKQNNIEEQGPSKIIPKESKTCSICNKSFAKVSKKVSYVDTYKVIKKS